MNYKIYHNPRCSKSREGLALLASKTNNFEIIDYIKKPPSAEDIENLLKLLKLEPVELVRTNESIWREHYKVKSLDKDEIIVALATHPKLIERPIIVKNNKAIIGRSAENILIFIK
ncbi:MAG: ArsC/Spx/MgsR family protein [Flavobacteriaceae bacterium]|nr:ArsC/Spx/MgsR family protein [Flavobacteriaceae bacterium]